MNIVSAILWINILLSTGCGKGEKSRPSDAAEKDTIPAPAGWKYYGGDEFNETTLDKTKWRIYGDGGNADYGRPQGMIQRYRPEQVQMVTLTTGEKVVRITSVKRTDGDSLHNQPGWWSGAISSREVNVYYPLYCRMDVRAKVVNEAGVWHAIWSRYYKGASTAEIDLEEFFVRTAGKGVVSQAIHLWNSSTNTTDYNLPPGQNRNKPVADPANTFHIYSMQVEKDPANASEAIITLLVDNVVNYSFSTAARPGHNKFILDAMAESRQNNAWDMVITGQVGATLSSVGYPEESLTTAVTEMDWFRVYVRP